MRYFPISVDTRNKKVIVIGGGKVAYRKVSSLMRTELLIEVLSIEFIEKFHALSEEHKGRLTLVNKEVKTDKLNLECDFLIIATDNKKINEAIELYAIKNRIPFLRADTKSQSSFIMNKVIEVDGTVISISTGGLNPALTKLIAADIIDNLNKDNVEE